MNHSSLPLPGVFWVLIRFPKNRDTRTGHDRERFIMIHEYNIFSNPTPNRENIIDQAGLFLVLW
jgi:hypothetical protein